MNKIGSWWTIKEIQLHNEVLLYSCLANRRQNFCRNVGGKLFVTNFRILFLPHYFDFFLLGKKWVVDIKKVNLIKVEKKRFKLFNVSLRDRLLIECSEICKEYFVVNNLKHIIFSLNQILLKKKEQ